MLHPLLKNVLQTVDHFEISCLGAPFSWFEKLRNCMGVSCELNSVFSLEKVDPPYSPDLAVWNIWAFPTMKRELRGKKF
jgi:hypothetical protein